MKAHQIPCYILHRRPFRETSLIIDVVAKGYGRLNLVLKGAQSSSKSGIKSGTSALAQVFRPLLLSFSGNGELKTALSVEAGGPTAGLEDKFLYSGFYINELICRLWPQNIASESLYEQYTELLEDLLECQQLVSPNSHILEMLLRRFEFNLLIELGFGIDYFYTCDNGDEITPDKQYTFVAQQGFTVAIEQIAKGRTYSGEAILAIGEMNLADPKVLKVAKQLARLALAPHLGSKPLKSRELFINLQS